MCMNRYMKIGKPLQIGMSYNKSVPASVNITPKEEEETNT